MTEPLVSIIVPIFNVEEYVSECVESIIKQSYRNVQIILVDDGSTDKSGEICEKYALQDIRIEVIHQKNMGLVSARKSGLQKAIGKYIGFVDGDDYIKPNMYGELIKEIERHDADFVHSGIIRNGEKIIDYKGEVIKFKNRSEREDFVKRMVLYPPYYVSPSIWSKLFKAEFIKKCYNKVPINCQYGEDLFNLCICIENCKKFVLLEEAYYCYRYREESITNKLDLNSFIHIFQYYVNICNAVAGYECFDELEKFLAEDVRNRIQYRLKAYANQSFQMTQYYCGEPEKLQGKKIVIYGMGAVGKDYYTQISRYTNCNIVAWVDTHPEKYDYPYIDLYGVEILDKVEFDILVIAVKERKLAEEIGRQLVSKGIKKQKILWSKPETYENMESEWVQ